jgi:putative nucleotidyltransferase with HDIG domain
VKIDVTEVRNTIKKMGDLPSLPMIVSSIVQLVKNPKTSAADITRVISTDPALTAKVLKLVNSAYYGFPREIKTLTSAIMILGFNDVKNLALSATVFEIFREDDEAVEFSRKKLWEHSVAVAVTARMLANIQKYREPEEVFIAGLLHDIGKLIIDHLWHDSFLAILKVINSGEKMMRSAEQEIMGVTHSEIGAVLCEHWNLPPALCKAVLHHHNPSLAPAEIFPITAFIHAADVFSRIRKIGSGGDDLIPRLEKEVWYFLRIKPENLDNLYLRIDEEVAKAESFLDIK